MGFFLIIFINIDNTYYFLIIKLTHKFVNFNDFEKYYNAIIIYRNNL